MGDRVAALLIGVAACQPPLVEGPGSSAVPPPDPTGIGDPPGGGPDAPEPGTPGPNEPIRLDRLAPAYGTAGHEVLIDGGPFPDDVVVRFGDADGEVIDWEPGRLVVRVPALEIVDGVVEVAVRSDRAPSSDVLAFRYFADGAGRIGAIGIVETERHVGGYWADSVVDDGRAKVILVDPTEYGWEHFQYAPGPDTCVLDWDFYAEIGAELDALDPNLPSIAITNGDDVLVLPPEPDYPYQFELLPAEIEVGTAYDLLPLEGNPDWPPFAAPGLTGEVPTAMTLVSPAIAGAVPPPVGPTFPLAWDGPYTGDLVLAYLARVRDTGGTRQFQESVSCWLSDDGGFVVPDLWTDWDEETDWVYVKVGRARRPDGVILPHNGAWSDVLGVLWTIGYVDAE